MNEFKTGQQAQHSAMFWWLMAGTMFATLIVMAMLALFLKSGLSESGLIESITLALLYQMIPANDILKYGASIASLGLQASRIDGLFKNH